MTNNYQEWREAEPDRYSQLVAHAARIGMELGADVIKTPYTGSPETFDRVVEAIHPVPIVIAGGPLCSESAAVSAARGAVAAGARGVSFRPQRVRTRRPCTNAATTSLSRA